MRHKSKIYYVKLPLAGAILLSSNFLYASGSLFTVDDNAAPGAEVYTGFNAYSGTPFSDRPVQYFPSLNNNGEVVGRVNSSFDTFYGKRFGIQAAYWSNGILSELGVVDCRNTVSNCGSSASAINDNGTVIGMSNREQIPRVCTQPPAVYNKHATVFPINGNAYAPFVNGWEFSWLSDVNNQGDMVGAGRSGCQNSNDYWGDYKTHGFLLSSDGSKFELGKKFQTTVANAVNSDQQVTGAASYSYVIDQDEKGNDILGYYKQAFIWTSGLHHKSPTPIGKDREESEGFDINDQGEIIGTKYTSKGDSAFLYANGKMRDLGALGGIISAARSINNAGQVVGYAEDSNQVKHAFLYQHNKINSLNELIPASLRLTLLDAYTVNENSQVLARAHGSACPGDFDLDGDVDGSDLAIFSGEFGLTDCNSDSICQADFDQDGDVDGTDSNTFSADYGKNNCTIENRYVVLNPVDTDGDGVYDIADNCTKVINADQRDTDKDGYGNMCDADLNNDGLVNSLDLTEFKARMFTDNPDADFNGDGLVNSLDLTHFKTLYFIPAGPSFVNLLDLPDTDSDFVVDAFDNCINKANSNQLDTDDDGYGNACDADVNNSGLIDIADSIEVKTNLGSTDPLYDFDSNGLVDIADLIFVNEHLGQEPGPSYIDL